MTNPTVDDVMKQAQVFASAWSLVGGRFDSGDALYDAKEAKKELEQMIRAMLDAAPAAPQQADPVAQIGWADEFGNLFPMGAWKPTQRTHHDSHKTAWRPVYLHPPAAEVQRLRDALTALLDHYVSLVASGDAGNWDAEQEPQVIAARKALEGGE